MLWNTPEPPPSLRPTPPPPPPSPSRASDRLELILLGVMIQAVHDARKLIARGEVEEAARLLEVVANKVGVNVFPPILPSGERAI